MNPFTKYLTQWSRNRQLKEFVAYWDELEFIIVQVHRQKMDLATADPLFERVWPWLRQHYGKWEATLRPFWQATKAAGAPTRTDPFQLLIDLENPEAILGNWHVMQHLPAAREALNQLLLAE